ncbi:MAG TPA: flagellar hook-associated protein FlgK [Vicinamibacterales bacterium]|nr:flagellar hook-associated protein FlgK [Vicinamibacterales bacterium]
MSSLLGLLSLTSGALDAQTYGLNTVGQNVANVNTPGYSRREVELTAAGPTDPLSAGNGVNVLGVKSDHNTLLDPQVWQQQSLAQQQGALADSLGVVQVAIGTPGQSLDSNLSAFFNAFSTLSQDPTSATNRQQVVLQGQSLATAFNQMAQNLTAAQQSADGSIKGAVTQINALTGQIAQLNTSIANAGGSASSEGQTLQDQQRQLVSQLSQLVGINTSSRSDGGLDISFAGGHALVIGSTAYAASTVPAAGTGLATIVAADGTDVTAALSGGQIGGLLQVRDQNIPSYLSQLDNLAYGVVQQVNALHSTGYDLSGTTGTNFFTPLATATGAASAIAVNPTVAANPSAVAAAATNSPGDNQMARNIAALATTNTMSGGTATFNDAWASLVYQVGQDTQTAQSAQSTGNGVVQQLQTLQDNASGVSLDQEATMMMMYQQAYQANAQLFSLVNSTLDTLLQMVK